ncbi:MAG: alpha-2-macroglobulin family protein [Saprospiraceae bacterium]
MSQFSKSTNYLLLLFISMMVVIGCKKQNYGVDNFDDQGFQSYVYAYTSGMVSKAAPIRVRFTQALVSADDVGKPVKDNLISFSPKIKGTMIWEDEQTILVQANNQLPSNTKYTGSVRLSNIFSNVPGQLKTFKFGFATLEQHAEVLVEGLRSADLTDLKKQEVFGTVYTADVAKADEVEKVLIVKQSGNSNLKVNWQHDGDQQNHYFTVQNVKRGNNASEVKVEWSGKPLGISEKGDEKIEVPALGDFKVMDVQVNQEEGSGQHYSIFFSDPIKKTQNLNGLIKFQKLSAKFTFTIDGNIVKAYPNKFVMGDRTVEVSRGIKNIANKSMPNPSQWSLTFASAKPQVKMLRKGAIMPNSNGLILPFEAVSLNAVDVEIFKIYEGNVLQFLQTNDLSGGYDLKRVGRVVYQKTVALNSLNSKFDANKWTQYALNLKDYINREPNAIYQVRIGFQKQHSTYFCAGDNENNGNAQLTRMEDNIDDDGEILSFWDRSYGYFSYSERDNPCSDAYYKSYYRQKKFAKSNVIASDLGLIAKKGNDNSYFVAVSSLISAEPMSDITVKFYDYQQQVIKEMKTDGDGIAQTKLTKRPFVVVAEQNEMRGYLKIQDGASLSLSRFDVSGATSQKGLKGFIYGERGVWRPGDTLFLNFILEDKENSLPTGHPVTMELYDARGQLYSQKTISKNVNRIYDFTTVTSPEDGTGNWVAKVKVGGATFQKNIRIETVKPNRLKIALDLGTKEIYADNDLIKAKMQVNWLHGAPARNLKGEVKVQLRSIPTKFKTHKDFHFDDPARKFSSTPKTIFNSTVDNEGATTFEAALNTNNSAPGMLKASFTTRVFEKSGDFSTDNFTTNYHPYNSYAGIKLPTKKYTESRLDMNKFETVRFVVVDSKGKPLANKKVNVGLYKINWRWWWDRNNDNISSFSSANHFGAKETKEVVTNSKGEATWSVKLTNWGRYMIRACDVSSGHCTGKIFYAGYPWNDNEGQKDAASMLSIQTNKKQYNVGETVELKIPMGKKGRALITLENGSRVVETYWMDAKDGENTFRFTLTKEMTPTIYAHVSLIQPHAQVQNDLPIRMYGVAPIKVEDPKTRLSPVAKVKDSVRPDEFFTVKVNESKNRAMAYTLAIVDEGLLDLTRFKTPDPWSHFYAREALGVKTWDLYDDVMGAYGGKLERILSIGGDMGNKPRGGQKANRFKPVVMHLGPFYLKKGASKTHKIKMPNYVGAVRVMVVAADNGAYGHFEKSVKVKKPLMVLGTLPRVLGPTETVKLPVTVFAMEKFVKNVKVKIETNSLLKIKGSKTQTLKFNSIGDKIAEFELDVAENVGVATVKITATSGKEKSYQEIELDVRNPNPYVTDVMEAIVDANQSKPFNFSPTGMKGTNKGMLEVSNIPPINLGQRLEYLIRYPHGCIEQTTSSGFPQLYVSKLLKTDESMNARIQTNISATLDRLRNFQVSSGGFAYWPGESSESHWGSNYAGHFMLEAKSLGYSVSSSMVKNWVKFQRKTARAWSPNNSNDYYYRNDHLIQAYRLYTLALADEAELGAMNRLREMKNLSVGAKWRLAAAYAAVGKTDVAKKIIRNLNTNIKPYTELSYSYGSDTRDRAMILETLTLIKDRVKAGKVALELSKNLSKDSWYSTQTIAYSLLAIGKYAGLNKMDGQFKFAYNVGKGTTNAGSNSPIVQIPIAIDGGVKNATIKNTGKSVLYARVILTGQPTIGNNTASSNDLKIAINYTDMKGQALDPSKLEQGTDFVAEVTVTHPGIRGRYDEMALTQIFPSGWEIYNTRLNKVQTFSNTHTPEYQDIKDDRVFTYFDIRQNKSHIYRIQLNAAYQGRYYLPTVECSAMYDNTINARQPGQWIEVVSTKQQAN